ncbi:MAG TPA: transketolase C-terminal domain-containing protein [Pirellulales bacterium]|nr:transketolase C-terminal domain-containing protein [Pirellulales bacterium]
MRTAFIEALCLAAQLDDRIWLLTADLGYSVLEIFAQRFPRRYLNVGVAEQNMAGIAAGLAHSGKLPVIYSIANFPTFRCLEQLRNDICHQQANVKIVAVGGGYAYGPQGHSHHAIEDLAVMRALPGMTVVAPADPVEARLATGAICAHAGPCYLRLGKAREPVLHVAPPAFELGRAIQVRSGRALTLISTGGMLQKTLAVAERLAAEGSAPRVLSMHTIKPLDEQAVLRAAAETGGIISVEEHSVTGGLGSAIADVMALGGCRVGFFRKFGIPDQVNHEVGTQEHLLGQCGDLYRLATTAVSQSRAA